MVFTYITVTAPGWEAFQARSCSAVIESASEQPGVGIRQQHGLLGREDRGRLGHEVDAAEGDHLGAGARRLLGEAERVAHEVGDVLDLGQLVVVGEDDGAALLGERPHLGLQRGDVVEREKRHFGGRASRAIERSSPGAEWVSAPIET